MFINVHQVIQSQTVWSSKLDCLFGKHVQLLSQSKPTNPNKPNKPHMFPQEKQWSQHPQMFDVVARPLQTLQRRSLVRLGPYIC